MCAVDQVRVSPGGRDGAAALLALFDDAVAWLTARGQTGQWGSEPFSTRPRARARVEAFATDDELWFAVAPDGRPAGAIVLGDAFEHIPPATRPELYVRVLLTASAWRGHGVGATLIDHAVERARAAGVEQLRVDCWDGVPELPRVYEGLGFTRVGEFTVGDWRGAVLQMDL